MTLSCDLVLCCVSGLTGTGTFLMEGRQDRILEYPSLPRPLPAPPGLNTAPVPAGLPRPLTQRTRFQLCQFQI